MNQTQESKRRELKVAEAEVCTMSMFSHWLVSIAVIIFLGNSTSAQGASKEVSSDDSTGKVFSMLGVGNTVQAAGDFLKAAEALERFGGKLEGMISTLSEGLAESSRNLAVTSDTFDPFGFKTAFKTIRKQGRTIQKLQKAEIRRLKKECKEMKKKPHQRVRKRRKSKSG